MRWEKDVQMKVVVGGGESSSASASASSKRSRPYRRRRAERDFDDSDSEDDAFDVDRAGSSSVERAAGPPSKAEIKNHTATLVDDYRIVVFGGYDGRKNHNAIRILDSRSMRWISEVNVTGSAPDGRNGHTATLADGKLYIIGGWLGQGPLAAQDMHIFDVATFHWTEAKTSGKPPGPCNMHTCDYVPKRRELYLFRGGDGQNYLNDLHVLDIDTLAWRSPETSGSAPSPRAQITRLQSSGRDCTYLAAGTASGD